MTSRWLGSPHLICKQLRWTTVIRRIEQQGHFCRLISSPYIAAYFVGALDFVFWHDRVLPTERSDYAYSGIELHLGGLDVQIVGIETVNGNKFYIGEFFDWYPERGRYFYHQFVPRIRKHG